MPKRQSSRLKRFARLLLRGLVLPFAIASRILDFIYGWRGRW